MKRISRIRLASVMAILLAVLFSCQTAEPVDTFIPEITASSELPVVLSQSYYGYEVTVSADDGSAVVTYPENVVTISDAEAFLLYEAERHEEDARQIIYDVSTPGTIILSYPEGSSAENLRRTAETFLSDIAGYVDSLFPPAEPEAIGNEVIQEPEIIEYQVLGYTAEFTVEDGKTTLALPPVVLKSDVDGFFVYEVAKYGSYVDGIYYRYTGNAVELTYPETITREDVKLNLPYMVADIEEYAATLVAPIAEESVIEVSEPAVIASAPVLEEPEIIEPLVVRYEYLGSDFIGYIYTGELQLILPEIVTDSDVEGFFVSEVEKYGSMLDRVYYRFIPEGVAISYPEDIPIEEIRDVYVPLLAEDIVAYWESLNEPEVPVAIPAEEPVLEIAEESAVPEPEVIAYQVLGYTAEFTVEDGKTTLVLPPVVLESGCRRLLRIRGC